MIHQEQRRRAHDLLRAAGVPYALLAHPATVTWLTGFVPAVPADLNPFAGGPSLVWYEDGLFTLIVMDGFAADAAQTGCPVVAYPGYTFETPLSGAEKLAAALGELVSPARPARIGVEQRHLPEFLAAGLRQAGADLIPLDGRLDPLRQVKTAEELAKLRRSFALTDVGQAAARQAVAAGQREIDVWTAVQGAIERAAGQRIMLGWDCVVGYREDNSGGWPAALEIRPGDGVVVDLGARLDGYWSDSCGTYYAGQPDSEQVKLHRIVAAALELAISLVKPGAIASEIDRQVRQFIGAAGYPAYAHHTGHSVGASGHEEPRLTPYNHTALAAGMVIMLEPGIYLPGRTGVRLEDAVLVTADGPEILTGHDKSLP